MNNYKTIDSLKEALRLFWLENARDANLRLSEHDLNLILSSKEESFKMTESKRDELINKLYDTVNSVSLGNLINESLQIKSISIDFLAEKTRLSKDVLTEIKEDKLYPNNIPVLLMKDLLNVLEISFKKAECAILKTYELIKRSTIVVKESDIRVAYRKNNGKGKSGFNKWNSSDASELYENRESLEKYLLILEKNMV